MSDYRSWEQMAADAELTHSQADALAAQAAKEQVEADGLAAKNEIELDQQRAKADTVKLQEELAQAKLQAKVDAARREQAQADEAAKLQAKEERAARGVMARRTVLALVVISILGALPSQVAYFLTLHKGPVPEGGLSFTQLSWMTSFVPFALECSAWGVLLLGGLAHRKGLSRWPFWLGAAVFAGYAAWVNYEHGTQQLGVIAGWALAACSILGPLLCEALNFISEHPAVTPPTAKELAESRRAATAQRQQADLDTRRKKLFRAEWAVFGQMLAAHPADYLPREQVWEEARRAVAFPQVHHRFEELLLAAGHPVRSDRTRVWQAAWFDVHRATVGDTASTWRRRVEADAELEGVLAQACDRSVYRELETFLLDVPRGGEEDGGITPLASSGGPFGGPSEGAVDTALGLDQKGRAAIDRRGGRDAGRAPTEEDVQRVLDVARKTKKFPGVGRIRSEAGVTGGTEYLQRVRDLAAKLYRR